MNPNEIKKDLENLINHTHITGQKLVLCYIFDYINELEAEVERLNAENTNLISYYTEHQNIAIKEFAERLNHYLVADTQRYYCRVSKDKCNAGYLVDDVLSGIDRIKKEMVGDEE